MVTPALAPEHPGSREPGRSLGSRDSTGASVARRGFGPVPSGPGRSDEAISRAPSREIASLGASRSASPSASPLAMTLSQTGPLDRALRPRGPLDREVQAAKPGASTGRKDTSPVLVSAGRLGRRCSDFQSPDDGYEMALGRSSHAPLPVRSAVSAALCGMSHSSRRSSHSHVPMSSGRTRRQPRPVASSVAPQQRTPYSAPNRP
jgi:hypothetical protein